MSGPRHGGHGGPDGRAAIEAAIPHRDPFLFVDEVVERSAEHLVARWRVPADGSWFRGHYPGEPVLPGVLVCEHCFQAAALLISALRGGFGPADGVPVLTKIEGARFKRIVRPGETLETQVALEEVLGPAWWLAAHVRCEGATVARVRFVLTATAALAESAPGTGSAEG